MKVTIDLPERSSLDVDEGYAKEALVATLYSNGGHILIGINDRGEVEGIDS